VPDKNATWNSEEAIIFAQIHIRIFFFIAHKHCIQSYQPKHAIKTLWHSLTVVIGDLKKDITMVSKEGYSPLLCNSLSFS
jgi:hypothetical protein